ncbi:MFS general substrate transporter [Aspergillus taichungensis]|uniref:MFS general substrate transporter n=1 Tax=Aspergillus taichungensis TaxID=482145 RepID=A0A2J5HMS9_9EURO|nr:MFS general substrate transporter [Aspergillus taichungensis]
MGVDEKHLPVQCDGAVQTAQHGGLHPQPTSDPLDPLNWSAFQKNSILGIVMLKYFLFTYITTTTVPSFPSIQIQFDISYAQVNWTVALPALGLSVGPLLWSSLGDIYGRRVVFLVGTVIALISTVGAAVADTYGGYMAARFFQGMGVSPASSVGMAVVNDLFFDYERGQKLGLWVLAIDAGLLLGPTFGGFLNLVSAAWINWFNAILFGVLLTLELLFMPETLYPRSLMLQCTSLPTPTSSSDIEQGRTTDKSTPQPSEIHAPISDRAINKEQDQIPRTKILPFINIHPVPGLRHPSIFAATQRFALTFTQCPVAAATVLIYAFTWYWWVLSVITMIPAAYADWTPLTQGLLFLGLLVGTVVSEVGCSGRLSDALVDRLARRNGGVRVAEMRLWLGWPAVGLTALGLILWGVSIDKSYHWIVGQVAFFFFASGIQIGNTITTSYIIDIHPLQSTSIVIFYAVFLNLSAFINPFFIAPWQESTGWTWTFTTQALIVVVLSGTGLAALQRFGASWRARAPVPGWVNAEFDS